MKRFSTLKAPVLACVLRERTPRAAIAAIKNAEINGADVIDLHLSCFDPEYRNEESFKEVISATKLPVLALHYNQSYDYSPYETVSEDERVELLMAALRAGADAVDVQGYTFDPASKSGYVGEKDLIFTKNNPKEIVTDEKIIARQCELIDRVHDMGKEVLLSTHPGIFMEKEAVVSLAQFLEKRKPDVIKIVCRAHDEEEMLKSVETMIELKRRITSCRIHFHAAGEEGKLTRILNPLLGGYLVFCNDGYKESSFWDQPDLKTVSEAIRNIKKAAGDF